MKYTRLSHTRHRAPVRRKPQLHWKYRQQGVALAIALILLGVLMVFTALAATLMTSETRLSAAQYDNARTFNAGMASLELMTDRINTLFTSNFNPTAAEIAEASGSVPIFKDGSNDLFTFEQKVTQLGGGRALVTVLDPPFEGLTAKERLFRLETIAQDNQSQTQVRLIRDVANYQIPIFQFAVFGFDSLDVSPGPRLWLGGRTHTNRNLFLMVRQGGNRTEFYGKITTVGEVCTEILPSGRGVVSGESEPGRHRIYDKGTLSLRDIEPSVTNATGPDNPGVAASYDYNLVDDPSSPNGGIKTSGAQPSGLVVTGIPRLLLPTESKGFQAIEILRRAVPADEQPDNEALKNTRFFNGIFARYSTIRILLDDDLEEFPEAIGAEPRAYDLNDLADPTDPFWVALANNVAQFNPNVGNDHPDQAAGAVTVGQGNPVGGATVTPPQTNIINHQPEFQRLANGNVAPTRKHTYIKIELLINDKTPDPPTRIDITRHILNLGITAGPIPVINNGLNAVDLAGNNSTTSPDGRLRASTTYINSYPLNDTRLTNTAADNDLNSNMLPWLDNSTTAPNIGKYKAALGGGFPNSPALTLRTAGAKTATISYRFEPNAILRLQRTYFPYEPNNNIDVTTADVPTQSDAPAPITAINNPAGSTGRLADNYPAKFKSLIAKPYFRFTDQFDNFTYVKGTAKLNNGMFELVNPFAEFPNT
ncbi:MAG TPA: pilus assembly PilX N-terminal domain-containing protein, partial [Acidobacteriota bacterium]|nr:pilus assembly PilX N-terminal domain-containing protein [Acidobacteriota bacterium]